jgi:hypothetical protein
MAEMEPFDEGLDRNIWALANSRHQWDSALSSVRRTRPRETAGLMRKEFEAQRAADERLGQFYDAHVDPVEEGLEPETRACAVFVAMGW